MLRRALCVYVGVTAVASCMWEILQLPFYTIWSTGTLEEQAFAIIHCTAGDVLIAIAALTIALVLVGAANWPAKDHRRIFAVTLVLGFGYTIYSEWLHAVVRSTWTYSKLMPVVPLLDVGLLPLLQWIAIPTLALTLARNAALAAVERRPKRDFR